MRIQSARTATAYASSRKGSMYEIGEAEVEAVRRVILAKKLFRYQPGNQGECDLFEREFSEAQRVQHSILLSSGTNALVAALVASKIGPGDEVLVPAYTFVATAAAVCLAGATPVVVNVDSTLGISVADAHEKITPKTKAIIPVHMDGLACDMTAILALAKENNLVVVEDCAQALGGSFAGRRLGSWGDAGAFSLNENKNLSCGEGGIVVTSNDALYERMFCMQDLSARYNPVKKELFSAPGSLLGMSMRVSEIQGAIMRVQLRRLDSILSRLRQRKRVMVDRIESVPGLSVIFGSDPEGDCGSSLHLRFDDPARAALVSKRLMGNEIPAMIPTLRPAHVAWKWTEVFDAANVREVTAGLIQSIELVMSVVKYDLDISLSLEETARLGDRFKTILLQT